MTRALDRFLILSLAALAAACAQEEPAADLSAGGGDAPAAEAVRVPSGFTIELFAEDLGNVRTLRTGPDGRLYAALSENGRVVRFDVSASDPEPETVADGLELPYGLAFHEGDLYVGEGHQVIRLD